MSSSKRKTININSEEESSPKYRRSSLAVNLSFTNLTDSGNGSLRKTQIKNNESNTIKFNNQIQSYDKDDKELKRKQKPEKTSNINEINNTSSFEEDKLLQNVRVRIIDIKHIKKTDTTCEKLRNAILNKTREIFNKQDECAIKTTLVLQNQNDKVLTTSSQNIIDQPRITTDEVTNIQNNTHNDKLSIFSTPINKTFNVNESIDKSKITKRRLFGNNDIVNPQIVKTVTEENHKSKNNLQQLSPTNLNYKSSPIISGNHKRYRISKLSLKSLSKTKTKCNLEEDLSQKTLSSLSTLNDDIESIGTPIFCSTYNEELGGNNNKFIEEHNINNERRKRNPKLMSRELTAIQVNVWEQNNTCIEKANVIDNSKIGNKKKSEDQSTKEKINQTTSISDKETIMNRETMMKTTNTILQSSQRNTEKNENIKSTIDKSKDSTEELESSLHVNTSVDNESEQESIINNRSSLQVNTSLNSTYKHRKSYNEEQRSKRQGTSGKHSQYNNEITDGNDDSTSYIESTPYNAPQSGLLKSQLKCDTVIRNTKFKDSTNIIDALNNINIKKENKSVDNSKDEQCICKIHTTHRIACTEKGKDILHNTIILDDSPIIASDQQKCKEVIIEDSLREHEVGEDKIKNNCLANVNVICSKLKKKKLLPLCENSELSFSPMEKSLSPKEPLITKKKKQLKKKRTIKQNLWAKTCNVSNNIEKDNDSSENNCTFNLKPKNESKKPRKINSKKIVIKKMVDNDILKQLENLHKHSDQQPETIEYRNSLNEFQTRKKSSQLLVHKSPKIIMVVTGFSKGDKNLIKSIVKTLGMARIEANVTRRTTHVVSTGVRTLNLLHGIIRGCWLVKLEWVLKSLENNGWLNPEDYEMIHFSKAVKENRKDRELFGMAYVPELFVTSGFLHVENGTTPPAHILKDLIKAAGGRITERPQAAKIIIGANGVKESWVLDSITTGVLQSTTQYQRK